jgi:hypothetical protein
LLETHAFFLELGLELIKLLKVGPSNFCRG